MLIIILILIAAIWVLNYYFTDSEGLSVSMGFLGAFCFILLVCLGIYTSTLSKIDNKIAMYNEENNNIQQEISTIVQGYKDYESKTFTNLKTISPVTLVTMFPELKSNELVAKQVDVYIHNNNQMKSLRLEAIDASIYRWWVYFGK